MRKQKLVGTFQRAQRIEHALFSIHAVGCSIEGIAFIKVFAFGRSSRDLLNSNS